MATTKELRGVEAQVKELLQELEVKERIEATVKVQLKELSNIYRMSESLISGAGLSSMLDKICEIVSMIDGVDGTWISLIGEDGNCLLPIASRKAPEQLLKKHGLDEEANPLTEVIRQGKQIVISDLGNCAEFDKWGIQAASYGYLSAAVFPLIYGNTVSGIMALLSCRKDCFSPNMSPLFQMYANQVSSAVKAAWQDEDIKRYQTNASFHENQYRSFLKQLPEAVFILDRKMCCTYCNPAFEILFRKHHGNLSVSKIESVFQRKDAKLIKSAIAKCLDGGDSSFNSTTTDGKRSIETDVYPIRSEEESVIGVIGIARDVSEKKHLKELKRHIEELNREIDEQNGMIDDSPAGVLTIKPDGTILRINQAAENMLGRSKGERINNPIYSLFPEHKRTQLATAVATALHSGKAGLDCEMPVDGDNRRYLSLSLRCRRTRNGDLITIYAADACEITAARNNLSLTSRKITERGRELEAALIDIRRKDHALEIMGRQNLELTENQKHIEELNRSITGQLQVLIESPEGIVTTQPDGIIISMNNSAKHMLNVDQDNSEGASICSYFHENMRDEVTRAIAVAMDSGRCELEYKILTKNDEERYLCLNIQRQKSGDKDIVVIYANEISETKKIKDKLSAISSRFIERGKELEKALITLRQKEYSLNLASKQIAEMTLKTDSLQALLNESQEDAKKNKTSLSETSKVLEMTEQELEKDKADLLLATQEIESLRDILMQANYGVLIADGENANIKWANDESIKIFDYGYHELLLKSLNDLVGNTKNSKNTIHQLLSGTSVPFECDDFLRKDGSMISVLTSSSDFDTPEGKRVVVTIMDASIQKAAKQQVERTVNQLKVAEDLWNENHANDDPHDRIATLLQDIAPKFPLLGIHSLTIILDDRAYSINESGLPGDIFSSEVAIQGMVRGKVQVVLNASISAALENGIPRKSPNQPVKLLAKAIGITIEKWLSHNLLIKRSRQIQKMEAIIQKQREICDPLQAIQLSTCLLIEHSGNLDSIDRARLGVIEEQAGEVKRIYNEIPALSALFEKIEA